MPTMHSRPTSSLLRAAGDGAIVAGLLFAGYLFLVVAPAAGTFGFDAFAYWSLNLADPYARTAGALGAFTYSPVIARLFAPFGLLAFWQFLLLWDGILVGTAVWLGLGSLRSVLAVFAFPAVALELYHGNVHLLIAAAIWLGFRYPAAWSFVLLTKVTPGVGLIWFVVRREWRSLAIALGVTAVLVAGSVAIDGRLWVSWLRDSLEATATGGALNQFSLPVPLWIRVPAAAALVAWGGLTDRRWTVPVAATLALPILWPSGFAVLAALWPILREQRQAAVAHGRERENATAPTPVAGRS
jgi:Glycosyltransferase family 87